MADTPAQAALREAFNSKLSVIPQTLSQEKQTQARANIGAAASADATLTGTTSAEALSVSGSVTATGGFVGNLTGTASKIANNAVTAAKIANNAVTAAKIANNAVTAAKIAANAVDSSKIKDGSIAFADLAAAAIATQAQAIAGTATNLLLTPQGAKAMIDNALSGQTDSGVPYGVMVPFAGKAVPDGWLLCNGAALAKASYPDLFAAIGYTWGGSGNTFYLPNYNGRHILGTTYANNVGSTVSAGLPDITGGALFYGAETIEGTYGAFGANMSKTHNYAGHTVAEKSWPELRLYASNSNGIYGRSSSVSVAAAYVLMIIKA